MCYADACSLGGQVGHTEWKENGLLDIYVDDFLFCMSSELLALVCKAIEKTWKVTPLAFLTKTQPLVFCGTTLIMKSTEIVLHQHAFVQELLQQYVSRMEMGGRGRETTSERERESFNQIGKKDPPNPKSLKELQG
eukprot:5278648-Amphidinium_carterae.1